MRNLGDQRNLDTLIHNLKFLMESIEQDVYTIADDTVYQFMKYTSDILEILSRKIKI